MRHILAAVLSFLAFGGPVIAGRPIILTETQACSTAELVVLATIDDSRDVPTDDFGGSKWHSFGFTRFARTNVKSVLSGKAPKDLFICGGKMPAGTDYLLEKGHFLILLVKVQDDAYRAVDWHYSFMPVKDGKIGWLADRESKKRVWLTPEEAVKRINSHKTKSEPGGGANPAKPGGSP